MVAVDNYTELKSLRYERKFPFEAFSPAIAERMIKCHPGFFTEIFAERWINNIYFDTTRMDFYNDNQFGKAERKKVRIRWYGPLFGRIESPILEVKIKSGLAGTKRSYKLPSFDFNRGFDTKVIKELLEKADLPDDIRLLVNLVHPTLVNRYRRKYYKDVTKDFRITLDWDMSYYHIVLGKNNFLHHRMDKSKMVIELKYDVALDGIAKRYSNYFPNRMSKHSKYVNGIELFRSVAQ